MSSGFLARNGSRVTFAGLGGTEIALRRRPREARCRECGLPFAVGAEQGVDERDQLAHDGDHGDLMLLAAGAEALEEGLHLGIEADC